MAPYLVGALAAERDHVAEGRKWLRRLRELEASDRAKAERERMIVVNKPAHLAGTHKL
jgi:hypothetical protein